MKRIIFVILVSCFLSNADAQNLGDKFDWLKLSYTKIPLRSNQPFYDTAIKYSQKFNASKVETNAKYYFESVLAAPKIDSDVNARKYTAKGTYTLYTSPYKDEEHTYTVNYSIDITLKEGKFNISMHDFDIYFLTNKVEFPAKYKHAEANDGVSNYFMALFHDKNKKEINKFAKVLANGNLVDDATAIN